MKDKIKKIWENHKGKIIIGGVVISGVVIYALTKGKVKTALPVVNYRDITKEALIDYISNLTENSFIGIADNTTELASVGGLGNIAEICIFTKDNINYKTIF